MAPVSSVARAQAGIPIALGPAFAWPPCGKLDAAVALRRQARQDARLGDHDRVCDTLDELGERYGDARDAFEDRGAGIVAIDLRDALRTLRIARRINRCD